MQAHHAADLSRDLSAAYLKSYIKQHNQLMTVPNYDSALRYDQLHDARNRSPSPFIREGNGSYLQAYLEVNGYTALYDKWITFEDSYYNLGDLKTLYREQGIYGLLNNLTVIQKNAIEANANIISSNKEAKIAEELPVILVAYHLDMKIKELQSKYISTCDNSDHLEDKPFLQGYLSELKKILEEGQLLFDNVNEEGESKKASGAYTAIKQFLSKEITECESRIKDLNAISALNIYEVKLSKEEYEAFTQQSENSNRERNPAVAISLLAAGLILSSPILVPAFVLDVLSTLGGGSPSISSSIVSEIAQSAGVPQLFADNSVVAKDIPGNRIKQCIGIGLNPHFSPENEADMKTIYIVDGKNPNEVFQHGTNYNLQPGLNTQGRVAFFEEKYQATNFIREWNGTEFGWGNDRVYQANKNSYLPDLGWHNKKGWQTDEKEAIRRAVSEGLRSGKIQENNEALIVSVLKDTDVYLEHLIADSMKEMKLPQNSSNKVTVMDHLHKIAAGEIENPSVNLHSLAFKFNHAEKMKTILSDPTQTATDRLLQVKNELNKEIVHKQLTQGRGTKFWVKLMNLFGIHTKGQKLVKTFFKKTAYIQPESMAAPDKDNSIKIKK